MYPLSHTPNVCQWTSFRVLAKEGGWGGASEMHYTSVMYWYDISVYSCNIGHDTPLSIALCPCTSERGVSCTVHAIQCASKG